MVRRDRHASRADQGERARIHGRAAGPRREATTARTRHMALRRFAAWLVDEGELDTNPLDLKPPKLDTKVTPALSDDQLKRFIKRAAARS